MRIEIENLGNHIKIIKNKFSDCCGDFYSLGVILDNKPIAEIIIREKNNLRLGGYNAS